MPHGIGVSRPWKAADVTASSAVRSERARNRARERDVAADAAYCQRLADGARLLERSGDSDGDRRGEA